MELSKALSRRKTLRSQVTKISKAVSGFVTNEDLPGACTNLLMLQVTHESLVDVTARVRDLSDLKEEEEEKEMEKEIQYLQLVSRAKTEVDALKEKLKPKPETPTPAPVPAPTPTVKLEHLVLPVFDGDITKFPQFWSVFRSRVHDDTSLTAEVVFLSSREAIWPSLPVRQGLEDLG